MKAKIDKNGILHIERAGQWIQQYCKPGAYESGCLICAHDYPHFGELEAEMTEATLTTGMFRCEYIPARPTGLYLLPLCHGTVLRGEITDERGAE